MDEKLKKVIELLEKEINGTVTIKDGMPPIFEFQLPRIGIVNITQNARVCRLCSCTLPRAFNRGT